MSSTAWRWKRHTAGMSHWYECGPYTIMHIRRTWKVYIDGEMVAKFSSLRAAKWWAQWRTTPAQQESAH